MKLFLLSLALLFSPASFGITILQSSGGGGGGLVLTDLDSTGEGVLTSGSFTPDDSSLLVVLFSAWEETQTGSTISDSAGLTWTKQVEVLNFGYGKLASVFTAEVTTGVSMTVTIGGGTDNGAEMIQVVGLTGYDTATPVGLTASEGVINSAQTGAYTLSMGGTTSSDGIVIGMVNIVGSVDDIDTGTGWTQLNEYAAESATQASHTQYFEGAKANFELDQLEGNSGYQSFSAIAIEINAL